MLIAIEDQALKELTAQFTQLNNALRDKTMGDLYGEVLEVNEAARYLKVTPKYLQVLRNSRSIPFSQCGKLIRYKKIDLDRWLDEHRVGGRK